MKHVFFFCLFILMLACPALAASAYQPGFRTLGVWDPEKDIRLDLAIWYPARRASSLLDYGNWIFRASRNAPPEAGQHPLVILSHDSSGSRFALHQLAAALACNGFIAAAPTHPGDNLDDLSALFTLEQIAGRSRDLSASIDILLTHPATKTMVNPQRIGVVGIGPGGTAALLLAGARPVPDGWADYCARNALARQAAGPTQLPFAPLYCTPWSAPRMNEMAAASGLNEDRRDARVVAAAAVAPWFGMFLPKEALISIHIPIMLVHAEKDQLNPPIFHIEAIRKALSHDPAYTSIKNADSASLLSACGPDLADTWPELCRGTSERVRNEVQEELAAQLTHFFLTHLASPDPTD